MHGPLSRQTGRAWIWLLPVLILVAAAAGGMLWMQSEPELPSVSDDQALQSLAAIMGQTRSLESNRDPKCHATASRLEDFIYGTPLTEEARFAKNDLQMALVRSIWRVATHQAARQGESEITAAGIVEAADQFFLVEELSNGDWRLRSQQGTTVIERRDQEHYGSIAYALRAILAVQQEQMLGLRNRLLPLQAEAVEALKQRIDLYTLAALQVADRHAREQDQPEVNGALLASAWATVATLPGDEGQIESVAVTGHYTLLRQIADQKLASYEAYNHISLPIFLRNLQVYFARHRWPQDEEASLRFRTRFTETMVVFSADLMKGAEQEALKRQQRLVRAADVAAFAATFVPHSVNEYEDVTYFPRLSAGQRVTLEAYDLDAFRDSGLHWQYLQAATESLEGDGVMDVDPFAAELLAENVAQFAVLLLRQTGEVSRQAGTAHLREEDIEVAMQHLQALVRADASSAPAQASGERIRSADAPGSDVPVEQRFRDVTAEVGIDFLHRSAAWLSRLIRSYTSAGKGVGNITIPPAFGGSGVAAEDIDNDGQIDLLLLSGLGNRLYVNNAGRFEDITREAGIQWLRSEDGQPGEPRQPVIADLDNDGWQDLLITYAGDNHRVYRNLGAAAGGRRFEDVTDVAGLGGAGLIGGPATVADFDNDGLLDLYIGYFGDYPNSVLPTLARRNTNGLPNQLFINEGGMRFRNATRGSGTDDSGWAQAVGHTDFDGDGLQDLIVGNDFGVNIWLRNKGNARFEDVSRRLGTDKPSYTMNIGLADLNDDLYPDVYISNIVTMNKDEKYVLPGAETEMKFDLKKLANMRVVEANDLFLSRAKDQSLIDYELSDLVGRGYNSTGWAWDADFFDLDNDGDEDLYVTNGMNEFNVYSTENAYHTDPQGRRTDAWFPSPNKDQNVLFLNSEGRLNNATAGSGLGLVGNSRSAAYLDVDNDGDLDVVLNNYHEPANFYRNELPAGTGGWLKLQLQGDPKRQTNRDAIGARIIATTAAGNRIWREVHGTIGYLSVHPKEQHLGVGDYDRVTLEVRWPNGDVQNFTDVATRRRYLLRQGGELEVRGE